jgi:hypothetical protein
MNEGLSMNKLLGIILMGAIVIGLAPYARGIGTPNPPPGISADNWVAMGESAGFVITSAGNDLHRGLRNEPNTMKGYFVIRRKDFWVRVDASPGYETRPANLAH